MRFLRLIFSLLLAVAVWFGCQEKDYTLLEPTPQELYRIEDIGEQVTPQLLVYLTRQLKLAISREGLVEALEYCNLNALPLTKQLADSFHRPIEVKRTSFKFRNPQNAPDELEAQALRFFEERMEKNLSIPPYHVQKVRQRDGQVVYNFYHPLSVRALCLNCHGDPGNMAPDLRAKLQELYPEDKAIGYDQGDFRGVVKVSIPGPLTPTSDSTP